MAVQRDPKARLDALGAALIVAAALWTGVTSLGRDGARPAPVLGLLLAIFLLVGAGRRLVRHDPALVPGAVAVGISGTLLLTFPDVLAAGGSPTGYANANAALAALGAIAAFAAAAEREPSSPRRGWAALGAALAVASAATGSVAGTASLAAATLLTAGAVATRRLALAVVGGAIVVSATLGVTVAVAAGGSPLGLAEIDATRSSLWVRALDLAGEQPWRGVGPGLLASTPPVLADADLRWAHHGYLQQAAEQGVIGLVLLLAVVGWTYARLWGGRDRATARTLTGAAATTVVALHSSVDHLLHHAAVPLTLAVLVGWATADRSDRETLGSRRRPP